VPLSQSVLNSVCNWGGFIEDVCNFNYFSWGIVVENVISSIVFLTMLLS
jgi:hypothetical protein